MLRELLAIWRSKDPLKDMYENLIAMNDKGERMFEAAWQEAISGQARSEVKEEVRSVDLEVNKAERAIRKRLVEHIAVQPGVDVPACLVLMSVVKDAERVGDYCKDILDAAAMETEPLSRCPYFDEFQSVYTDTHALFGKNRRALAESDKFVAEEVMITEREIGKRCDALLKRLASEDTPSRIGVPRALIVRHIKRLAAHLSNIASSLVMPLHKLDYHDKKWFTEHSIEKAQ